MATTVTWRGGDGNDPIDPSGSNNTVGFFGASFGQSVRVGEFQDGSFVTDSNGSTNFGALQNDKFISSTEIDVDAGGTELLTAINVNETTLRIQFNNDTPVELQNSSFRAFDRISINNPPSGVTVQSFEAAGIPSGHTSPATSETNTDGDSTWTQISGATDLTLIQQSGISADHYHYIGLSVSPIQIGQKTDLGFYYETEFL